RLLPNVTLKNERELGGSVLSHDEERLRNRQSDPLIKPRVTIRWLREILRARRLAFEQASAVKIATAIFQAGDEQIVDRNEARRFYDLLPHTKFWKEYEGWYHE